jgi:hypothetical protein
MLYDGIGDYACRLSMARSLSFHLTVFTTAIAR